MPVVCLTQIKSTPLEVNSHATRYIFFVFVCFHFCCCFEWGINRPSYILKVCSLGNILFSFSKSSSQPLYTILRKYYKYNKYLHIHLRSGVSKLRPTNWFLDGPQFVSKNTLIVARHFLLNQTSWICICSPCGGSTSLLCATLPRTQPIACCPSLQQFHLWVIATTSLYTYPVATQGTAAKIIPSIVPGNHFPFEPPQK